MLAHYESAPQAPGGEWMARLKLGGDRDQGVQGHLDDLAVAQAEGLISLPDPRINSGSPFKDVTTALTVKTRRNCHVE
jgi:hypothetical protein